MNDTPATVLNDLVILAGGVEIEVHYTEGEKTSETIKVRQLPLRRMTDFGAMQGDEGALIELFCNRPSGWADTLELASAVQVVELGMRLNLDPFAQWAERRLKANEHLRPLLKNLPLAASPSPS